MDAVRKEKQEEEFREKDHPPELLELKRRAAEHGLILHLPRPGAKWIDREPIDFGVSVSDIVIRNRGREPDAPLPNVGCSGFSAHVSQEREPSAREIPEDEYPPELLELKRNAARHGVILHLPRPGAKWVDREPIDFGVSASDIVIRNRGKEP